MNFIGALFLILGVVMVISGTRNAHFWLWLDDQWKILCEDLTFAFNRLHPLFEGHSNKWWIGVGAVLTLLGLWIIL